MLYRPSSSNNRCDHRRKSKSTVIVDQNHNLYVHHIVYVPIHILVTGGAGFIGGHLAESFVKEGHDVTALDILEPFYDIGLKEHNIDAARNATQNTAGSYELVKGSTTDTDLVDTLMEDIDVVYRQAAQAGVLASVNEEETN